MNIPGAYSQRDPRWGSQILGFNSDPAYNLYSYGCLVTCLSNMLWYMGHPEDPGSLNSRIKMLNGFEKDGGLLKWEVVPQLSSDVVLHGATLSYEQANAFVGAEGNFAIIQVSKPNFSDMHFVLLTLTGTIVDPWDGLVKAWPSGYAFHQAHLYGDTSPNFVAQTQPVAAPAVIAPSSNQQGDPIMTPDQEAQAYRIVLNRDPEAGASLGHRSGWEFIQEAQAELTQQRQADAVLHKNLQDQLTAAQSQTSELRHQLDHEHNVAELINDVPSTPATVVPVDTIQAPVVPAPEPVEQVIDEAAATPHETTDQFGNEVVAIFGKPPVFQLEVEPRVTDLATGLDIQRIPVEVPLTIERVIKKGEVKYLQTPNMVTQNHGISEQYFQYYTPLNTNEDVPSKEQVGRAWHSILKALHLSK